MDWDKIASQQLRSQGLTQDQIGFCIGLIAEHRMQSDREGYKRGFNSGVDFQLQKQKRETIE